MATGSVGFAQTIAAPLHQDDAPLNATLMATASAPAAFGDVATLSTVATTGTSSTFSSSATSLPDAPSTTLFGDNSVTAFAPPEAYMAQDPLNPKQRPAGPHLAPIFTKYIPAGWTAQKITARDKIIIGARDLYSPLTLLGDVLSAGYSDISDGQPNYGVDRTALGKRVGATFIRDTSEGVFSDMVFTPLLHEDPRYYVEGPSHNFFQRVIYSVTRPVITRTDSGRSSVNGGVLLGYAAASGLSYTYYPEINKNFRDTTATFGGALGGAAIGDFVSEFADQFLQAIHLEKRD